MTCKQTQEDRTVDKLLFIIASDAFFCTQILGELSAEIFTMEKLADIELTSIEATDPKPRSFANNANAVLIQVYHMNT